MSGHTCTFVLDFFLPEVGNVERPDDDWTLDYVSPVAAVDR